MWSLERRRHLSEKNLTQSEEREERMSPGAVPPQNTPTWVMGVCICVKVKGVIYKNIFIKKITDLRSEGTLPIPHFHIVPARVVGVVLSHLCTETKVYDIERHIFSMKKILNLD